MEMQEKPKSRTRSKTVPAETAAPAKSRKSRSRKTEATVAPEISTPIADQAPVLAVAAPAGGPAGCNGTLTAIIRL